MLIRLRKIMHVDKVLKWFGMQDSKIGFLLMSHGIPLSNSQSPSTPNERDKISAILYASIVGSIICHALYTPRCFLCS